MDKYYLTTSVPPPDAKATLIKVSGSHFSKWDGSKWTTEGDPAQHMMGDEHIREASLQEAEEYMRGIAP